mgnify:CR=1 FL=1
MGGFGGGGPGGLAGGNAGMGPGAVGYGSTGPTGGRAGMAGGNAGMGPGAVGYGGTGGPAGGGFGAGRGGGQGESIGSVDRRTPVKKKAEAPLSGASLVPATDTLMDARRAAATASSQGGVGQSVSKTLLGSA